MCKKILISLCCFSLMIFTSMAFTGCKSSVNKKLDNIYKTDSSDSTTNYQENQNYNISDNYQFNDIDSNIVNDLEVALGNIFTITQDNKSLVIDYYNNNLTSDLAATMNNWIANINTCNVTNFSIVGTNSKEVTINDNKVTAYAIYFTGVITENGQSKYINYDNMYGEVWGYYDNGKLIICGITCNA